MFYAQGSFPSRYHGGVFIAFHGCWNRAPFAQGGYHVVFQALDSARLAVPEGATRDMVVLGERIYHGGSGGAACSGCHGAGAAGTPLGPSLVGNHWLRIDGTWAGIAAYLWALGQPLP